MKRLSQTGTLVVMTWFLLAGIFLSAGTAHAQTSHPQQNASATVSQDHDGKQVIAYFTQWGIYQKNYLVKNIVTSGTAAKLTVLDYAFANISSNLQCASADTWADYQKPFTADQTVNGIADTYNQPLAGNFNQLRELKALYPRLKILISIGGWTLSTNFSAAASPQNVSSFVHSCIDQYILGNQAGPGSMAGIFDGIDIDWEYPDNPGNGNPYGPQDIQNYTHLLKEFQTQLHQVSERTGKRYLLTADTPAGQDKYQKLQLGRASRYVSWMDIMTYDMHGPWNPTGPTDFNAPLYADPRDPSTPPTNTYSVNHAVNDYLAAGVPANKIVIGLPIYGHVWTGVPDNNNGLYQSSPLMQPAPATSTAGTEDYRILENLSGYTGYRDRTTQQYWIFNGSTFWSYDDPTTVAVKMRYVNSRGLAGAFAWSLDEDDSTGSFMNAVSNGLLKGTPTPLGIGN